MTEPKAPAPEVPYINPEGNTCTHHPDDPAHGSWCVAPAPEVPWEPLPGSPDDREWPATLRLTEQLREARLVLWNAANALEAYAAVAARKVTAEPLPADVEATAEVAILAAFQAGQQDGMRGYGALPDKEINDKQEATEAALYAMLRRLAEVQAVMHVQIRTQAERAAPKVVTAEPVAWRWIRGSYITDWRDLPVPEGFTEEGVIEYAYAHPPVGEK